MMVTSGSTKTNMVAARKLNWNLDLVELQVAVSVFEIQVWSRFEDSSLFIHFSVFEDVIAVSVQYLDSLWVSSFNLWAHAFVSPDMSAPLHASNTENLGLFLLTSALKGSSWSCWRTFSIAFLLLWRLLQRCCWLCADVKCVWALAGVGSDWVFTVRPQSRAGRRSGRLGKPRLTLRPLTWARTVFLSTLVS